MLSTDICSMKLKSNTEMKIDRLGSRMLGGDILYTVTKGKALIFHDQKVLKNSEFKIETPETVNTAIGTDFMVNVLPEMNKTWVGVLDGSVMVKSLGHPLEGVMVNSGQKTEVSGRNLPLVPQALADEEWAQMQELYQIGVKPQVALLISTGEDRVRELLRPCSIYISDRKNSQIPDILRETVVIFNQAIKEKNKAKHLEAISKFEEILESFPNKKYDVQFLLFIGAYYNYLGEYQEAIDTFENAVLRYPDSHLASLAQCATGVIYEEGLLDKKKALESYRKVLLKYPNSPEASFARSGIDHLTK